MTDEITVLQVGDSDLSETLHLKPQITWIFRPCGNDADESTEAADSDESGEVSEKAGQNPDLSGQTFDIILITKFPEDSGIMDQIREVSLPHRLFYLDTIPIPEEEEAWLDARMAVPVAAENLQMFADLLPRCYFRGQYGAKLYFKDAEIFQADGCTMEFVGNAAFRTEGNFGEVYRQLMTWRYNIPTDKGMWLELYPEFSVEGTAELLLHVVQCDRSAAGKILREWNFSPDELLSREPLILDYTDDGVFAFSFLVRGSGKVRIGALHYRYSRCGCGMLLAGGERIYDAAGEELAAYFDPGNQKPPLNIYFSGYRTAEGFEGYFMLKNLGHPFLLLADPRLEGGQFYIGSREYEENVERVIREKMDELHFTKDQVIFSGLSMGTYGAVYYGAAVEPHAVVAGKPLLNIGSVAANLRTIRPNDFETAADLLLKMEGDTGEEEVRRLNARIWTRLAQADLKKTLFAVGYMKEDDYDPTAYMDLERFLEERGTMLYGKGLTGRHNDNTNGIVGWFLQQYREIIRRDFEENSTETDETVGTKAEGSH